MAATVLGETPIEIGGKRYRFVLGTYGLKQLEQMLRKPWVRVFTEANNPDALHTSTMLAVFHAGLLFHHEGMTERQASLLLDELGIDKFTDVFKEAAKSGGILSEDANPPQPVVVISGNGTGLSQTG